MQTLEVRNFKFPLGPAVPRYWHGGRRSVTLFFDNLSVFFPPGERFFIQSVRAHRERLQGKLADEARAFYLQEGIHSREHDRYNKMLREQGFPVEDMEKRVDELLADVSARLPVRYQLAITCALEHFTALMAEILLRDDTLLEGADPALANLWRWHAAEENEHKSVAYDVFSAVGGSYPERATAMIGATVIFWAKVAEHQLRLMRADGIADDPSEWLALFHYLFVHGQLLNKLTVPYLKYFRPGFHPEEIDTTDLLENWKRDYEPQTAAAAAI